MEYFDPHSHTQALSEKGTAKSDTGGRGEYVGFMEYSTYQNPTGAKSKPPFFSWRRATRTCSIQNLAPPSDS